jgi:hypothetical protein
MGARSNSPKGKTVAQQKEEKKGQNIFKYLG